MRAAPDTLDATPASAAVDEGDAIRLLELIVATPSINPAFRGPEDPAELFGEERLAQALQGWLAAQGIAAELDEVEPGRPNLVARVVGTRQAPAMLWEGHLDTVQVTGMADPFAPRLREGRLFGRGSVDDGGCVAAFLLAVRALAADPPPGDVELLLAVDEEVGYRGILHHLRRGERFALGVAGEPTGLRVVRACKGVVRWNVELTGRPAHAARPDEGLSAVHAARALLDAYEAEIDRRETTHPLLGQTTLVCTGLHAGEGPNTVPARARLRFDCRTLPHEAGLDVHAAFRAVAEALSGRMPGLEVAVADPFVNVSGMEVPEASEVVRSMAAICEAWGLDAEPVGVPFGSDATRMVVDGGIPTIVFGPGSIEQAHAATEHVEVAQVVKAAGMLVALARSIG